MNRKPLGSTADSMRSGAFMEAIGDYSENPFQGLINDIPMMSLCRTIEIDLREKLNEKELPPQIEAIHGVLN